MLKKNGEECSGTIRRDSMGEEVPLNDLRVKGNQVTFSYPVTFGGNTITVHVDATISEKDMTGIMRMGEQRSFNLSAKRSE